jgi:hypothetical protein
MTHDISHHGAGNGTGGRFNDSVEQIIERQTAEAKIRARVAAGEQMTAEDLPLLPGDLASELMAKGALAHLGLGRRRTSGRRG